jgi:1-acyl-sn-glycerol-3-phosphate acyltransferase
MFRFSSVYRLKKAIRIILRWHAFGQNSFSLEWDFTIKSKSQVLEPDKSYMIVANHTSMTDIMLMPR